MAALYTHCVFLKVSEDTVVRNMLSKWVVIKRKQIYAHYTYFALKQSFTERKQLADETKHLKADSRRALVASKITSFSYDTFNTWKTFKRFKSNRNLSYNWVPRRTESWWWHSGRQQQWCQPNFTSFILTCLPSSRYDWYEIWPWSILYWYLKEVWLTCYMVSL